MTAMSNIIPLRNPQPPRPVPVITTDEAGLDPAMRAAFRMIERSFSNPNKLAVIAARSLLRLGPADTGTRLRFGWLAQMIADERIGAAGAAALLGHYQRMANQGVKCVRFRGDEHALSAKSIPALRLAARWVRRHARGRFDEILAALTTPVGHQAHFHQAAE